MKHPKNPFCQGCLRAKVNAKQARRRHIKSEANAFGDIVTADHLIARDADGGGIGNEQVIIFIKDQFSNWMMLYPTGGKSADKAAQFIAGFQGNKKKESIKLMYTDNALELIAAASRFKVKRDTSTSYRPTANSIAERSIRTVTEGTRTLLEQSGFPVQWWPYAARCFRHSMNSAVIDGFRLQ